MDIETLLHLPSGTTFDLTIGEFTIGALGMMVGGVFGSAAALMTGRAEPGWDAP